MPREIEITVRCHQEIDGDLHTYSRKRIESFSMLWMAKSYFTYAIRNRFSQLTRNRAVDIWLIRHDDREEISGRKFETRNRLKLDWNYYDNHQTGLCRLVNTSEPADRIYLDISITMQQSDRRANIKWHKTNHNQNSETTIAAMHRY